MIRAYLHRGAHRANRFSVRVADVQAAETLRVNIIPMPLSVGEPGYA